MINKYKHQIIWLISAIVIWELVYRVVENPIIFPSSITIFQQAFNLLFTSKFYIALSQTLGTITIALISAYALSFVFIILANKYELVNTYFGMSLTIIRSIPTIAFVINALIWFGKDLTAYIVLVVVLIPMIYYPIKVLVNQIEKTYAGVLSLSAPSTIEKYRYVIIPLLKNSLLANFKTVLGMSFKVVIMAEIVTQSSGLGLLMSEAKSNLAMADILAYTMYLIIIVLSVEKGFLKYLAKKELTLS